MNSDREQRITSIFHSAIAREPHERAPYLDGACGDDEALRREVEELIKSHESAGSFIDSPAYEQGAELLSLGRTAQKRAGQSIGPYKIISLVGAGGMGEVYRAHDSRLGREVALKLLPESLASGTEGVRRFQQEARAASALNHPNILAIYDIGEHDGSPYIVSELLEGETLREKLSRGPLAARKALDYALQTARGLVVAHDKGIVHRDLKPENLFVTKDGRVKILDFGIAKLVPRNAMRGELHTEAPTMMVQTDAGMVIGTAGYMSPEQVRGQTVDTRSDIFSFGAILYEALSGQRAFHGASPVETMNAILKEEPAELSSTNSQISPSVERVVRRCLEKQPHERFQSASDLAFAVESLSGAQGSGTTNAVQSPVTSTHGVRRMLGTNLGWIAAALLLLSTLTFAVFYFLRAPDQVRTVRFAVGIPDAAAAHRDVEMHSMAVSPDGRHLAFIADAKPQRTIWVRALDAMSSAPLLGTEGADSVFWSPDSRHIAFFAEGKLKRIEFDGKSLQTVCNLSAPMDATASWGSGGTIIFSEEESGSIYRVSSAGGAPSLVVEGKGRRRWVHFLPDGRRFLFYKHNENENNQGIYAGSLDSKEISQVAAIAPTRVQYVKNGYLLYVREGSLVARAFDEKNLRFTGEPVVIVERLPYFDKTGWAEFSASEDGVLVHSSEPPEVRLVWLDRGGREIGQAGEPGYIYSVRLSPDGQKAAVDMDNAGNSSGADIWIQDLARNTRSRFVSGPTDDNAAVWSADGRRLAYFSCCEDDSSFHIKELGDTGKGHLPVKDQNWAGPVDWTRDGRFILYWAGDGPWVLPVASGEKPYQWRMKPQPKEARFSPDGRWVAVASDETGRPEVYVTRFDRPGEKWRVSTEGGFGPRWRGDGKELFYVTQDLKLMSVQVKAGEQFDVGSPTQIFRADPLSVDYDVAADGQRFIFVASVPGTHILPFAVVLNWNANLKR